MYAFAILFAGLFQSVGNRPKITFWSVMAATIILFGIMNANKEMAGDWTWYTAHYKAMEYLGFSDYLGKRIGAVTTRVTEPVYYLLAYLTGKLSGYDVDALAASVTIFVFGVMAWGIWLVAEWEYRGRNRVLQPLVVAGVAIFAINFSLSTHLVRQELAASFVVLGFAFLLQDKLRVAIGWAIVAFLTHQSAAFLIVTLYAPLYLSRRFAPDIPTRTVYYLVLLLVGGLFGYAITTTDEFQNAKNDGAVADALLYVDGVIFAALVGVHLLSKHRSSLSGCIIGTYVLFYAVYLLVAESALAALRVYFYMDSIRAIAVFLIIAALTQPRLLQRSEVLIGAALIMSAIYYQEFRISRSPFDFGGGLIEYSLFPFY